MNADVLLKHFDRIAEAPDAVARLRQFVLDLAVRGKLVEQDSEDEPAEVLLERIRDEKAQLLQEGKIRKSRKLSQISGEEKPFQIPHQWIWVRLGEICSYIQRGRSPKYAIEDGLPVVSQRCVQWTGLDLSVARLITRDSIEKYDDYRFLRDDDLLWNSTGTGTIGRIIRLENPPSKLVCDSHVTVVRGLFVNQEYVRTWLRSDHVYGLIEKRAAGSTNQVELTAQMANNQVVPLPPLAEQHRIVAKVVELMALCDELEAARNKREARRDRLVASSLHRLQTAPATESEEQNVDQSAITLRAAAHFHLDHLPRLVTRLEHVNQLRQMILDLAVRGRLAPQDSKDEPAALLLKRIAEHRSKLLDDEYPNPRESLTQLKKQASQRIPDDLVPLPPGWEWATLMQCSLLIVDCHNKTAPYSTSGIPLIRTTNVRNGMLNQNDLRFVDQQTYARWSARCEPEPGDILITREAPMGEVAIIPDGMKMCLGQRMMLARLVPETIDSKFLLYSLRDPRLMERVQDKPVGATVQHLRVGGVETLLVPLPPLAEQHRIVAKVDELMTLCDQLEAQLTATETHSRRLLEAVLQEALSPASVEHAVAEPA